MRNIAPLPLFDTRSLKAAHPIADLLAARGVRTRRVGRNLVCRCPLHQERHGAAFVIDPQQGLWKCFGKCQAGGDVIHLVMRLDGCDFPEACRRLGGEPPIGSGLLPRVRAFMAQHRQADSSSVISHHTVSYLSDFPAPPATLTEEELNLRHDAAAHLALRPELCERIARHRGWKTETVLQLALEEQLGWHQDALAFLYPHGMKLRSRATDGTRRICWLFGGNHELWRSAALVSRSPRSLWLCEGETDAISLINAGREEDGTSLVFALPCASAWHPSWLPHFADRQVFLVLDNDEAGQRAAERLTHELRGTAARVFHLHPQTDNPAQYHTP